MGWEADQTDPLLPQEKAGRSPPWSEAEARCFPHNFCDFRQHGPQMWVDAPTPHLENWLSVLPLTSLDSHEVLDDVIGYKLLH